MTAPTCEFSKCDESDWTRSSKDLNMSKNTWAIKLQTRVIRSQGPATYVFWISSVFFISKLTNLQYRLWKKNYSIALPYPDRTYKALSSQQKLPSSCSFYSLRNTVYLKLAPDECLHPVSKWDETERSSCISAATLSFIISFRNRV